MREVLTAKLWAVMDVQVQMAQLESPDSNVDTWLTQRYRQGAWLQNPATAGGGHQGSAAHKVLCSSTSPLLTAVIPVQVAAMRVQEQAFSSVTVGETEKVDLTDAHKAPVTANGLAAGASTSGLPTPISEDTSRSHVAHGATGGHCLWSFSMSPFTQAVYNSAGWAEHGRGWGEMRDGRHSNFY